MTVEQDERGAFVIDSGAALKVAERFGFPLNAKTVEFAQAIVKRAGELQARAASTSANVAQNDKQPLTDHLIWEIADLVWRRKSITTDRAFELDFAHEVIAAALHEACATSPANAAQGAEAVGLVMTSDKGEKYGALLDSNIEDRTKLYVAPPAQTALNILSDLAAVKRYSLDHHISGKGRTSTTLNVPNELLDRIDALLQRPVTGDPADDAADDAAASDPADDAAEQA